MEGNPVLFGIDGHRLDAQLDAGPKNTNGYLAPVGGHHFIEFPDFH
jgi:hypothetical protein